MKILIVDDDELHGRSVRDLLAAHNYPADVATSGVAGLEKLQAAVETNAPYQVLILDLHIPDYPGTRVLQEVRRRGYDCKTIILSGESELESITPILKLGAIDYIRKPFSPSQLINSVSNAVSRYALEQEHALMQQEAQDSAQLYEFLLNASPDLIYMLDPDGHFRFANTRLSNIFQVDTNALLGQPWRVLFNADPQLAEQLNHLVNERRTGLRATMSEEFSYTTDVGSQHTLELSAIGLYENRQANEQEQSFVGTYGVIRDVTESKRTRQALIQSQRKFYSLFVDSPDAMYIADVASGEIRERNPQFLSIRNSMGADDDTTDGFLWGSPSMRREFIQALKQNQGPLPWRFERDVQGEQRQLEIHARLLELEGQPTIIGTLRDRTEEHRAEQDRLQIQRQLQQAGRMEAIGQVAGGIAHDFNNILASIIGYTELVMNARHRLDTEQVDQYLHEVVTAGQRARDLISQMLTFTRAKRVEETYIDAKSTVEDVSRMLRAAVPSTIELETVFADDITPLAIAPVQLQQIIINLLINARDAIDSHGRIVVEASNVQANEVCQTCGQAIEGAYVAIKVSDTGHGIDPEIIDEICKIYFSTRDPEVGTGIGLWVVNNIVHEHDGHLTITSRPGEGTEFTVYLPAQAVSSVVDAPTNSARVPRIDGRILVVDDEVSVANFIAEVLRDRGYPTVVFSDSSEAMEYLEENLSRVSLLLADGKMPMVSGVDLARYVKEQVPDIPVIFITGFAEVYDEARLGRLGVDRYLRKPFSIDEMINVVTELVGESAAV